MHRILGFAVVVCVAACSSPKPTSLRLNRVILYQNGIGYFERSGVVGGDRLVLEFSHHEVDDVLKTLTVIDRSGSSVATVDVPTIGPRDRRIAVGVKLSGGTAHDVQVSYAIPIPTWRAAYRIVIDQDDHPGLLQAWAVIDNASQEDWTDVALTLATGAPMSYQLDLHTPKYIERPDAEGHMVTPAVLGPVENEKIGAADGDTDGDGIANKDDLCPDAPEDKDGFEDADGCPDPDNDKDRIADKDDKCPNEPETYNGFDDDDGCPDRGRVVVTETAMTILDKIYFEARSDRIKSQSGPILDAIAATLEGNPSITLIEVQGFAAANEPDAWGLATRRAAAVRGALIQRGVDGRRLQSNTYGNTRPVDSGKTEAANAKNRRVEFSILKRSDDDDNRPTTASRPPPRLDTATVQATTKASTKPVEVAGAVRYELATRITIPRNTSTMVSILNKQVPAEDAYLWRPDDNAPGSDKHPFRAIRLVNGSGFTLQPGPVAIFARGTFVGDSLLDSLGLDETAWIPYALDSSTRISHRVSDEERPLRVLAIKRGVMVVENSAIRTTRYTISVGRQPPRKIYLHHRKSYGYTAKDLPPGTVDQGDSYLVPLPIQAVKASELAIDEREPRRRSIDLAISVARPEELLAYVEHSPNLPAGMPDKLRSAIALRTEMTKIEDEVTTARSRFTDVVQRAQEIRDSIKALERVQNADDLRRKLVGNLRETTTESDALTKTIQARTAALATARTRLQDLLRDLVVEEPKP